MIPAFITAVCAGSMTLVTLVILGVGATMDVKHVDLHHGHSVTCVQVRGLWSQPISCDWAHAK